MAKGNEMRKLLCLTILLGLISALRAQPAGVPAELPLPGQLRELDRDYANGLESLLTKAKVQDDKALIADIESRLAVTKQYRTIAPKREAKSLLIVATLRGDHVELHLSRSGMEWRRSGHPIVDITLNGIPDEPAWKDDGDFRSKTLPQPPAMAGVVSYEVRGQVTVTKIDRGPGKYCLCITKPSRVKADEPVTFKLLIKYLPPLTAAGRDGVKESEKQDK